MLDMTNSDLSKEDFNELQKFMLYNNYAKLID